MISVTILTKNSSRKLLEVLKSVASFDEVIVLDSGSTDESLEIAKGFSNVRIHKHTFTSFGHMRNLAAQLASHDWIFVVDSDEVVSSSLASEIRQLELSPTTIYSIPSHNFFGSKHIRHSGWSPDRKLRLYNKQKTCFKHDQVHENLVLKDMAIRPLNYHLNHYSYPDTRSLLSKMELYSTLFAKQYQGKRSSSITKALLKSTFTFFKTYILKRGFLDGKEGFIIAKYNADVTWYKYIKLAEANSKKST
jgi:glycosyltransferase involved in cell wall biosynthesis